MFQRIITPLAVFLFITSALAAEESTIKQIVNHHILKGYIDLVDKTNRLANTVQVNCLPDNTEVRELFHLAFDAWIRVSHLRFGPSEIDDRAFVLWFWPDTRGRTPKALRELILSSDSVIKSTEGFKSLSIAARGFHALEFMLYDQEFAELGNSDYRCELIQAITLDINEITTAILEDWENGYANLMLEAGSNDIYRNSEEAIRQIFTSLLTSLQITSELRLGRPLGTFEKPRPMRAESRRSGRSLKNVIIALEISQELTSLLSRGDQELDKAFEIALSQTARIDDPIFLSVSNPEGRLKIEILQQSVDHIRQILYKNVGLKLGISSGFNALDGD